MPKSAATIITPELEAAQPQQDKAVLKLVHLYFGGEGGHASTQCPTAL